MRVEGRKKSGRRIHKAAEFIVPPTETDFKFSPTVHLSDQDWNDSAQLIHKNESRRGKFSDLVKVWMRQRMMDPEKFSEMLAQDPDVNQLFQRCQTKAIDRFFADYESVESKIETLAALRQLFLNRSINLSPEETDYIEAMLNDREQSTDILKIIQILFFTKQFPESPQAKTSLSLKEWERFQTKWKAVWEEGQLEDVLPEKLVSALAMLRILNPEKFSQIKLDEHFWKLALEWLNELRRDQLTTDLFRFAFSLYLLSADQVSLTPDGNLIITPDSQKKLRQSPALPERNIAA